MAVFTRMVSDVMLGITEPQEFDSVIPKMAVPNTKCLILIFRRISASSSLAIGITMTHSSSLNYT